MSFSVPNNASDLLDQLKRNHVDVGEMESRISSEVCKECSSQNVENINGSLVCSDCGTIFESLMIITRNGVFMDLMTVNILILLDVDYQQIHFYHNLHGFNDFI